MTRRDLAIDPPPRADPDVEFQFWRWLPNWHNHYLCPDCRRSSVNSGILRRHIINEHPRWRPYFEELDRVRSRRFVRILPQRRRELWIERWKDPAFRARHAAAVRDNWKDPAFRARHAAAVRETLKSRWKDPAFRARNAAAVRETLKSRWKDPAFRARNAAAVRDNWKDPAFRARNAAAVRRAKPWEVRWRRR